jgi:hypothetical protein
MNTAIPRKECQFDPTAFYPSGMRSIAFCCPICGQTILTGMPHPDFSVWDTIDSQQTSVTQQVSKSC